MLDFILVVGLCSVVVCTLFLSVRLLFKVIRGAKPSRMEIAVERWWIILGMIVLWLMGVQGLLAQGDIQAWKIRDYVQAIALFAYSVSIVVVWKRFAKPTNKRVPYNADEQGEKP